MGTRGGRSGQRGRNRGVSVDNLPVRHDVVVERAELFLPQALAGVHLMYHARSYGESGVYASCMEVLEGHIRERQRIDRTSVGFC